ncbi:MAG: uridylate kinase [Synergistaceae bacterium]|jgi:acetylglutamate/LysW-gamma-L-alpha-aminoadipate kinase|nr:uridylate kinase [Synergistaceae bacterium]
MFGVVKIGGAEGNRVEPLLEEIARRTAGGERWVVVHGASGIMNRMCGERGIEVRMITSPSGYRSRFVGEAERAVFEEAAVAYGGSIKKILEGCGASAERTEPRMSVLAKRKEVLRESVGGRIRIVRGNYSGTVVRINGAGILELLSKGVVPIMPPLGHDAECSLDINIDGDRLAAAVACELGAEILIVLSNVPGLMRDVESPDSRIDRGALADWDELERCAQGNMKRKMVACREALEGGIARVYLADGRVGRPIENAIGGNATCLVR